ncbi:hypothetical protein [Moorena sp. SIO3H5]|nr:hypothetical protein [Moorena sp. SIO3H5]
MLVDLIEFLGLGFRVSGLGFRYLFPIPDSRFPIPDSLDANTF